LTASIVEIYILFVLILTELRLYLIIIFVAVDLQIRNIGEKMCRRLFLARGRLDIVLLIAEAGIQAMLVHQGLCTRLVLFANVNFACTCLFLSLLQRLELLDKHGVDLQLL